MNFITIHQREVAGNSWQSADQCGLSYVNHTYQYATNDVYVGCWFWHGWCIDCKIVEPESFVKNALIEMVAKPEMTLSTALQNKDQIQPPPHNQWKQHFSMNQQQHSHHLSTDNSPNSLKRLRNQVSMIRKYHNHTLQTNPRHREEVSQNTYSHKKTGRRLN